MGIAPGHYPAIDPDSSESTERSAKMTYLVHGLRFRVYSLLEFIFLYWVLSIHKNRKRYPTMTKVRLTAGHVHPGSWSFRV